MTVLLVQRRLMPPRPERARQQENGSIVLGDVSWDDYRAIREALRERPVFLTYDRGTLEIMTLSPKHERFKGKFAILIHLLARHFRKAMESFGSFTQQREDLAKGLESDDCFYIDSLPAVRDKEVVDLSRDPPPDLALELDVKHSSMNRLAIYQAMRIPEVWRFDGKRITVYLWRSDRYVVHRQSPTFPGIPMAELVRFVHLGLKQGDIVMWELFDEWLKQRAATPVRKRKGTG